MDRAAFLRDFACLKSPHRDKIGRRKDRLAEQEEYFLARQCIGILGGTFDPIHQGHLEMARSVLATGLLEELEIVPCGNPPYKACAASPEDRWKMAVAACAGDARLHPSRRELDSEGGVYTVDTLEALRRENPRADLYCVIGGDAVMKLRFWRRIEDVLPLCTFLVCPRADDRTTPAAFLEEVKRLTLLGGRFIMVPMDPVAVSSTGVRNALAEGKLPLSLDVAVREYISCKGLYGMPGRLEGIDRWMEDLFAALNPHRFAHSLSVAFTARRLARIHGIDPLRAEQAGLLHDCAKCLPLKEMQRIAREHALTDDEAMLRSGALLHALTGAWVARQQYGMVDPEVLEAISCHNTGRPGMSRLAMCVCLSDTIEPLRESFPLLERTRVLAELSLERALLLSLEGTADYVRSRGKYLHPRTQETIAWLKTLPETRKQD